MELQINQHLLKVMEIRSPHHQVQVKTQYYKIIATSVDHNVLGGESKVSQTIKPDESTKAKTSGNVCM